jgi:HD-GYP domain-containing protein (c-di-GMP phosphodiesterase class II)
MALKRIPVDSLKVGMYVAGFDRSWLSTSFLTHSFLIKTADQIHKLKQSGVAEVDIDPSRGLDHCQEPRAAESPASEAMPAPEPPPDDAGEAPSVSLHALGADLATAVQAREEMLQAVEHAFEHVATKELVNSQEIKHVVTDMMPKVLGHQAAFLALIRTRKFDPALRDHVLSVCTLSLIMGKALGYDEKRLRTLAMGAMLHDVGMLRLPNYMLRLSKTLSKPEMELYQTHPRLGVTLLQKSGGFHTDILRIVVEHHATLDQSGYPADVPGRQTGEMSQLVMIADRYDEMLTGQLGVTPISPRDALSRLYMDANAHRLNQELVAQFIKVIGVYPLYSVVVLSSGDRGIVTGITPGKLHQPVVLLVKDAEGHPYAPPIPLDLSAEKDGSSQQSIVSLLDAEQEGIRVEEYLQASAPGLSAAA